MAKLSSGTLEAIRNFGKEGMLTGSGQRMAPVTPAQTFGGGAGAGIKKMLGGITGGDFRSDFEVYKDNLKSATGTKEMLVVQRDYARSRGDTAGALEAQIKIDALNKEVAQQQKDANTRSSMAKRARDLGQNELAETIQTASEAHLLEIGKDLRSLQAKQFDQTLSRKETEGVLRSLSTRTGIDYEDIKDLSVDEATKYIEVAEGASTDRYELTLKDDSKAVMQLPESGGKVFYNGSWQWPAEINAVKPDPRIQKTLDLAKEGQSKFADFMITRFEKELDHVGTMRSAAEDNNRSFELMDKGVNIGAFANLITETDKVMHVLSGGLLPLNEETINTIDLRLKRSIKVLEDIKKLGSGTGISNADLLFMREIKGQDLSKITEANMLEILEVERRLIEGTVERFGKSLDHMTTRKWVNDDDVQYFNQFKTIPEKYEFKGEREEFPNRPNTLDTSRLPLEYQDWVKSNL
tara:strand:- start:3294 stop:4691 length:1398 start_codon:yes stop_codon:yes gene_type:complete